MSTLSIHSRLNDLIDADPRAAQLLMELGVDCEKCISWTIGEVCSDGGIDSHAFLEALSLSEIARGKKGTDWSKAPLVRLIDHVIAEHHAFARRQMARLELLIEKTWRDEGDRVPSLRGIRDEFAQLRLELQDHLRIEEEVLFPLITVLARAKEQPRIFMGPINRSIAEIGHDFDESAASLRRLRALTDNFNPPVGASPAYQAFLQELSELELDLEDHAYLENQILFPRAIGLEKELISGR